MSRVTPAQIAVIALAFALVACRSQSAGQEPTVLVTTATYGSCFDADATEMFWTEGVDKEGSVELKARPLAGGATRTIAKGRIDYAVARGAHVYFGEERSVARVARAGGPKETLASEDATIAAIAVDGDEVFYVASAKVRAVRPGSAPRDVATGAKDAHAIVVTSSDVVWLTAPMYMSSDPDHGAVFAAPRKGGPARKLAPLDVPGELVALGNEIWFRDASVLHHATMPEGMAEIAGSGADPIVGVDADGVWMAKPPVRFGGNRGQVRHVSSKGLVTHRTNALANDVAYRFVRTTPQGAFASDGLHIVKIP